MANQIKVRIARRCMLNATEIGEVGDVVELDVPQAANLLGFGGGEAVDPAEAKRAIDAWNAGAIRSEAASQPRAPQPSSWNVFPPEAPRPWARH